MLWLPDATVKYLSGKHIPLFITAVLILLGGLVYTALLFSSHGNGSSTFQAGGFSGAGQGIQKYKLSSKPTTHPTLPSIATGLDCY